MDIIYDKLSKFNIVEKDKPLKDMTTLRIGGNARYVLYPENTLALQETMRIINENNLAYKIVGKGSNLLCGDTEFNGCIIKLDRCFNEFYFDEDILVAQAGCSIIQLAYEAMKNSLSGLEFACGIPGTVGGTIFMNAGAYKSSMSDIVTEVMVFKDGDFEWIKNDDCKFSYRHSIFQENPDWIIIACRIKLVKKDQNEIRKLIDQRRERRMATQPLDFPSAGSVFRNPDGMLAWQLIEELGFRGKMIGGAMVSEKHANFIINANHSTCIDFLSLVMEIQQKVLETYNQELHMEVEKFNCEKTIDKK